MLVKSASDSAKRAITHFQRYKRIATVDTHRFEFCPGQNISERYKRLENSLREKQHLQDDINALSVQPKYVDPVQPSMTAIPKTTAIVFHGFTVPEEPDPPSDDGMQNIWKTVATSSCTFLECCMSGCAICVYDLYEEAMEEYKIAVETLRTFLRNSHIPETEWPENVQGKYKSGQGTSTRPPLEASRDAFAALEASLKGKDPPMVCGPSS